MAEALTAFTVGLLAANSPCVLPLYPGFLAYLSGSASAGERPRALIGALMLAGVMTMMLALGAATYALQLPLANTLSILIPLATIVLIAFGLLLIFDRNPFKAIQQVQIPLFAHPYANAYAYGLLYGPIVLPCSGPLVLTIFALSVTADLAISRLVLFLLFGLGIGLPLLLLSFLSGAAQRKMTTWMLQHSRALNIVGGIFLIGAGIFDF
ncbi:MAG: sulfite exporter TauE/SafE family protein, partial [Chloroflexi bacterium]|nr:sulfite exporter TauE/SafE family protein [Chloroflexota bacterium]